ncbi:hypothetical protein ADA01nite_22150 [Aneurinibacillus danicus]|jgi:hypothetical protein|uniref:Uncharacterized protein n=1 Tax=Aneurinibacillus danicus TaxID=267746 RepID=A0A511V706_9BACL|nr:hypothetical protein ADA01nite_22150 [Aneurinibacillus danicus]
MLNPSFLLFIRLRFAYEKENLAKAKIHLKAITKNSGAIWVYFNTAQLNKRPSPLFALSIEIVSPPGRFASSIEEELLNKRFTPSLVTLMREENKYA